MSNPGTLMMHHPTNACEFGDRDDVILTNGTQSRTDPLARKRFFPGRIALLRVIILSLIVSCCGILFAQSLLGSIAGMIVDDTGATVPGARVYITEKSTNQVRVFVTSGSGTFLVSALPPGVYMVRVEAINFENFTADNVTVTPGAPSRVDTTLKVGSSSQTVSVNAGRESLQTDTAEVRHELTGQELADFQAPASRNYESALILLPGVTPPANANSLAANPGRGLVYSTNGGFQNGNNERIDGASAINPWLPEDAAYNPGLDAIDSVTIVTNSYDAQEGLSGGASVNVHIKTGGNQLHGSIQELHVDNALEAKPFFLPTGFTRKPKDVQNEVAGTIGGPIRRDRLFYFFGYDGRFVSQTSTSFATVPTTAMRAGDFSGSANPIYDPATGTATGAGKTAFNMNQISSTRFDSIAQKILATVPLPNVANSGITNNYYASGAYTLDNNKYDADVQWKVNPKLTLLNRFGQLHFDDFDATIFPSGTGTQVNSAGGRPGRNYGNTFNGTSSATYLFNQNLVYNGFFTTIQLHLNGDSPFADQSIGIALGIPGTNGGTQANGGYPDFAVTNFSAFGNPSALLRFVDGDSQFQNSFTWTHGRHTIAFGGGVEKQTLQHTQVAAGAGTFNFTGAGTTIQGGPGANAYNTFADFLLGYFASGTAEREPSYLIAKWLSYNFFIQDQWQFSPRFFISAGVRWDRFPIGGRGGRGYERYNYSNNTMEICGVNGNPHNCGYGVENLDFSPSLGLTYKLNSKTVLLAGAGINHDAYPLTGNRDLLTNFPNDLVNTITSPTSTVASYMLEQGLPAVVIPNISSGFVAVPNTYSVISAIDHNKRAYFESWNLSLQREWKGGIVGRAGYVGTRGVDITPKYDSNAGLPGGGTASEPLNILFKRTTTTYLMTPIEHNQYDAIQLQATKRAGENYTVNVAYTWSKAFAYCCDTVSGETLSINAPGYLNLNRALSALDRRYVFTAFGTAKLPFGKGEPFLNRGLPAAITGGWQVVGVLEMYAGSPFTVSAANTSLNAGNSNSQQANRVKSGRCINTTFRGSTASYVDPTCFAPVTTATFGTAGFNSIIGPDVKDLNGTVQRVFAFHDRYSLTVRGEVFNLTNTPHFANPSANISNVTFTNGIPTALNGFGSITSVNTRDQEGVDQRFYRLSARINF